jgi:hypothetical protein
LEYNFKANVVVRHLYVMPKEVGFVIEIRDLKTRRIDVTCSFAEEVKAE